MKSYKNHIIIILLLTTLVSTYFAFNTKCNHIVKYNYDYIKESELKYFETKSKLVEEVQHYMYEIAPTTNLRAIEIIELCDKYAIDVKFVLAQAEIESVFGTKGLAAKTRSVFNLGAFDNYDYNRIDHKYKYQHPNASIEPYLKLLNEKYLVDKLELDLLTEFVDKHGNRYASDEYYEQKLSAKYRDITQNTKIDSLQNLLTHYAIKCNR